MPLPLPILPAVAAAAAAPFLLPRAFWLLRGPRCDFATACAPLPDDAFADTIVWITGASAGIGASVAHAVALRGAHVILTARREDALRELADALPCPRERVLVLPADLLALSGDQLRELAAKAAAAFPGVDGEPRLHYLFNNAGVSSRALAEDVHDDNLEYMIRLNFVAPVTLSRALLPVLRNCRGAIVNTSSIASVVNTGLRSPYCSTKAALSRWHECLRLELLALPGPGVDIVDVCPGSCQTDIARNAMIGPEGARAGVSDRNIDNGLPVDYVGERMAAAAYARLESSWIVMGREFIGTNIAYYLPGVFRAVFRRTMLKELRKYLHNAEVDRAERAKLSEICRSAAF